MPYYSDVYCTLSQYSCLFPSSYILCMCVQAGSHVREELVSTIIAMISENTEEHGYSVQRLFKALSEDISQHSLCQIAVWTIGEFGDLLVAAPLELEGETLTVSHTKVL